MPATLSALRSVNRNLETPFWLGDCGAGRLARKSGCKEVANAGFDAIGPSAFFLFLSVQENWAFMLRGIPQTSATNITAQAKISIRVSFEQCFISTSDLFLAMRPRNCNVKVKRVGRFCRLRHFHPSRASEDAGSDVVACLPVCRSAKKRNLRAGPRPAKTHAFLEVGSILTLIA